MPVWDSVFDDETGETRQFVAGYRSAQVPISRCRPHKEIVPKAIVAENGCLVKIVKGRVKFDEKKKVEYRPRGKVVIFSKKSRARLLKMLGKLRRDEKPLFVTLTYPDQFPDDPLKIRRDLDCFGKRFRRKWPGGSFIWRLEYKTRKSGERQGEIAPHFQNH